MVVEAQRRREAAPMNAATTSAQWVVEVIETANGVVVKSVPCAYERKAEKVEAGLLRNMNRDRYHTRIVAPASAAPERFSAYNIRATRPVVHTWHRMTENEALDAGLTLLGEPHKAACGALAAGDFLDRNTGGAMPYCSKCTRAKS